MLKGKEQKTGENNNSKPMGKGFFVVGCVIIYFLIVGIVSAAIHLPVAITKISDNSEIKKAKVVLYDGPKSLKDATDADLEKASEEKRDISLMHCVDTKVAVNGKDCYVYDTNVNNTHTWMGDYMPAEDRTPITYFDFEGKVKITVTVPNTDIEYVNIRPLKYNIKPEINTKKHTVTFTIDTPDAYTVEFNKKVERAVHIFANEIEKDVPDKDAEGVKYIGPGEWNIEDMVLEDGDTIYISGGAVVHGAVTASFAKDVTVRGRGIIDNSNLEGWKGTSATVPLRFDNCQYVTVEGIISLNANAWCFQSYNSVAGDISNLKIITARPNGDGISLQSCKSFDVENCFVRTWDDSLVVKNYDVNSNNIKFKNVQVWTDLAQSMEIGYETNKGDKENSTIENVTFEDITVLHNFHKPVLSIHNADNAAISNVTYKNIVVEDACMGLGDGTKELIDLQVLTNSGWSTTSDRGTISNVTIDGFKVLYGNESLPSQIKGFDEEHGIDGTNVALDGRADANGFNDVYRAPNIIDGSRLTYWEGSPNEDSQIVSVDLKNSYTIHTVVVGLNPAQIWGKRTQTFTIEASDDGQNYTEVIPSTDYDFDPKTGNQVVIDIDNVKMQYIRLTFTKNTGAVAGQIAELEVYTNDK